MDLYEDKDNTYVRAELPGVNREDINVEIVDGLAATDRLVLNPSDSLADGDEVAVVPPSKDAPPAKGAL